MREPFDDSIILNDIMLTGTVGFLAYSRCADDIQDEGEFIWHLVSCCPMFSVWFWSTEFRYA